MVCRAILISLNSMFIAVLLLSYNLVITPSVLTLILLLQIVELGIRNSKSNDKTISFLESLVDSEEVSFNAKNNSYYAKLKHIFESLIVQGKVSGTEAEKNSELLDIILQQISIGIVVYYNDGEVLLINKSARRLLSVNYLNRIGDDILSKLADSPYIHSDSSQFILDSRNLTILSFQNIKEELDNKELNSWNELIRTLNHEIMNSITPISSLANSALTLVDKSSNPDLIEALEVIESRSSNLLTFVENYRSISQIPTPNRELLTIKKLLENISTLMNPYLKEHGIAYDIESDDEALQLYVDPILFENVIINLLKNSVEAESTTININYSFRGNRTILTITDDGVGLSNESKEKAFLPFYTTKPTGSGLGLSLVRQIMFAHGGSAVIDEVESGYRISLLFP